MPVLAIVGPTGVGKTALGVALAGEWPLEAVSVDSRQVYRRMDIGTGKPTIAQRRTLPHHLIDVVDPDEPYHAARFARDAAAAITDIRARGRHPVLIGGTGLYLRALVRGLGPLPAADPALRRRLREEVATGGPHALHARLGERDPEAARRLHPKDVVRVTRALEIVLLTGRPLALALRSTGPGLALRVLTIGLTMDRDALYQALDLRVDRMLDDGLRGEVEGLIRGGFAMDLPAMQGIGYRHLGPVLTRGASMGEAVRAMKRDTRRYAKRQWTWFAREDVAEWVVANPGDPRAASARVKRLVESSGLFA